MSQNIQVASLTAPITVKVPTKVLNKFQAQLEEIADTLEHIVEQLGDLGKAAKKNFGTMGKGLKVQNITQKKYINGQEQAIKNQKKQEKGAKRTAKVFGFWSDKIAQVRVGIGLLSFALSGIAKLLVVPTGFFTAFTFLAGKINASTTEMMLLSKATGFAFNDMRALEMEAKALGFTFEHVNSLVEELNNKLGGEAGGFVELNLQEGLSSLGIASAELQKLKPEKQLARIMNAGARMMKDGVFSPEAASAFDKIFGQEGNRMLTGIAQKMNVLGMSYDQIIAKNKRISAISKEAQKGAMSFSVFFKDMTTSIDTVTREFFGKFGSKLAPFLKGITPVFENISNSLMSIMNPVLDELSEAFQDALFFIADIFDDFKNNPEKAKDAIKTLIVALKSMFKIGMSLATMLSELLPLIQKFVGFIANETVQKFIAWGAAIVAITTGVALLFAGIGKLVAGVGVLLPLIGTLAGALGATGLTGILLVLGKLAAAFAVGWGIGKLLMKIGWINKAVHGLIDALDLFGRKKAELEGRKSESETMKHHQTRLANLRRLGKHDEADKFTAVMEQNRKARVARGEGFASDHSTNVVHNYIEVNDPVTGQEVNKKFTNARP